MGAKAGAKRAARAAAGTRLAAALAAVLERLDRDGRAVLPVLMYHRIADAADIAPLDPRVLSATPREFEEQIAFLAARRRVLSLADFLAVRSGEAPLPPTAVMVTFDDAYRDFGEHAWPTLRRHGVPVTLFVPTSYPDDPARAFWWDRLHRAIMTTSRVRPVATPVGTLPLATGAERARTLRVLTEYVLAAPHGEAMAALARLERDLDVSPPTSVVLGWDELRRLAREGVALAPHSRTHPLLDRVSPEEARDEIRGSLEDLERQVGRAPRVFAYPGGAYSSAAVALLGELAFEAAFTTRRGRNELGRAQWLELARINVGRRSTLPLLRAQLVSRPRALDGAVRRLA